MLFDRSNEENLKFGLEKSYHKSIVEAHSQQSAEINVVATLNLFFIDDVECNAATSANGEYEITNSTTFDRFSLIKPRLCKPPNATSHINEISTNFLPIGRYFLRIRYRRVIFTNDSQLDVMFNSSKLEKESLADLSLLPLAIRAQIVYEHLSASRVGGSGSFSKRARTINTLAIDSHLLQIEINKKRDELIKEAIIRSSNPMDTEALLMSAAAIKSAPELDEFIKTLEIDLNSYYICEKLPPSLGSGASDDFSCIKDLDLVKLNRLDALASFKCVQKYRNILWNVIFADKAKKSVSRSASMINRSVFFISSQKRRYQLNLDFTKSPLFGVSCNFLSRLSHLKSFGFNL